MTGRLLLLALAVSGVAAAQDARLVLREAVVVGPAEPVRDDTAGWETATMGDDTVLLGDVLMALGEGDVPVATVDRDPYTHAEMVSLKLGPDATAAFSALTESRIGQAVALVLDGRVLMAPTINERIPNGRIQISGAFARKEVRAAVAGIRAATARQNR